jgi:Ser-tRNA(Ala) deacylase AlaX
MIMKETRSVGQAVKTDNTIMTDTTTFYTIKGRQDLFNDDGLPIQIKEDEYTYAKEAGLRRQIRIDDRGHLINPNGLYANTKVKMDRWVPASKQAFASYLFFLKTKNEMYLRDAERNIV